MREIASEECDRARERGETGYPAMWEADRLEILEDCLAWLEIERNDPRSAGLPLAACEVRFGPARPGEASSALARDAPVELQLEGRTLRYAGRIDRVTWDADPPSQFRVVDYKTGKLYSEKSAQLQGGRMLQLPLYVYAAAELLGVGPGAGEAAYVYPTRKGGFDEVRWSREDLATREDELNALLVAMLEAMDRGDFMIAPWHTDACRICDLDPVCPLPRGKYVERRENDERIVRFNEEIRSVE